MMSLGSFSVSVFSLDCLIWMSGDQDIQIKQSKLNTETENEPSDIIPPHLMDIYDRAIKGLNPEERKKLKSLLILVAIIY
jgi:hypothetical protein